MKKYCKPIISTIEIDREIIIMMTSDDNGCGGGHHHGHCHGCGKSKRQCTCLSGNSPFNDNDNPFGGNTPQY